MSSPIFLALLFVLATGSSFSVGAAEALSNQAAAEVVVVNGFVVEINVTFGGSGYLSPPPVSIVGTGTNAQAVAFVQNGSVISIAVTDAGYGYDSYTQVVIGPSSFPDIKSIRLYSGIEINAQVGSIIDVQGAASLKGSYPWAYVGTVTQMANPQIFFDPVGPGQAFYRVLPVPTNPNPSELVWIGPGTFWMGSPEREPGRNTDEQKHLVSITEGFWIGRHETTQNDYIRTMLKQPSFFTNSGTLPVESITWQSALDYCQALTINEQSAGRLPPGYVYRLPTEAEWEYAARSGSQTAFAFGDDPAALGEFARFATNSTGSVGAKSPTPPSLFDIYGNVAEWCLDWYAPFTPDPVLDPRGPTNGTERVVRGGSWASTAAQCRSANRDSFTPESPSSRVGLRVVLATGNFTGPNNPNPAQLIWIPPGVFLMGSPSNELGRATDETLHSVSLTKGIFVARRKVTFFEFSAVTGIDFGSVSPNAAANVSWQYASSYCQLLTQQESAAGRLPQGYVYRLPTEAEWEFAARAGTRTRFFFGDDPTGTGLNAYAWYNGNCGGGTPILVGQKLPSPIGLFDIYGYLMEWCSDWYAPYPLNSVTDPSGPSSGQGKVCRGGYCQSPAAQCRSAARWNESPSSPTGFTTAFRVVLGSP